MRKKTNCGGKLSPLPCVVLGSGLAGVAGTRSDCPGHSLGAGMGHGPLPRGGLNALLCFGGEEVWVGGTRSTWDIVSGLEKGTGVIQVAKPIWSKPILGLGFSVQFIKDMSSYKQWCYSLPVKGAQWMHPSNPGCGVRVPAILLPFHSLPLRDEAL